MPSLPAEQAARWLLAEHDARHRFAPLPASLTAAFDDFVYDVQDGLNAARLARGATIAGYKIGLTTPVMQQLCHGDRPIAGVMFAGGIRSAPCTVRAADFVRLGIESELAVRLGAPLAKTSAPVTRSDVARAVAELAAAFELIEDRGADYARLDWRDMAADNSWHAGLVLGPAVAVASVTGLDGGLDGRLRVDGRDDAGGTTRDVLGHPYDAVAWLANHLRARGTELLAGQWISTGSIAPIRHAAVGQHFGFTITGLPPVEISIA